MPSSQSPQPEADPPEVLIIDTEGVVVLREVAVLDLQGAVRFHARVGEQTLSTILEALRPIITGSHLIAHNVVHDQDILTTSYQRVRQRPPAFTTSCTYQLARKQLPGHRSYALAFLGHHLALQVNGDIYRTKHAHQALYDAQATLALYHLLTKGDAMATPTDKALSEYPNPFASNRVDNPYQTHPDYQALFATEFKQLTTAIAEVARDANSQSKGVVVIGEPGTGKTHLMMRLAKERLKTNRLFFIRQPNNPDALLSHIYARILESFSEAVPGSNYSQFEQFIACTLTAVLRLQEERLTKAQRALLEKLEEDSLILFQSLGGEGTDTYRKNWENLGNRLARWYSSEHSASDQSGSFIKALVQYCRYKDASRRQLVREWLAGRRLEEEELASIQLPDFPDELSSDEFALNSLVVLGRLSLLDQPMIIIFDQVEGLREHPTLLSRFGEALKEILSYMPNSLVVLNLFPEHWQQFQNFFDPSVLGRLAQHKVTLQQPTREQLQGVLSVLAKAQALTLEDLFNSRELDDMTSQARLRLVIDRAGDYFRAKAYGYELPQTKLVSVEERLARLEQGFSVFMRAMKALTAAFDDAQLTEDPEATKSATEDNVLTYLSKLQQRLERSYDEGAQIIHDSDDIGKLKLVLHMLKPHLGLQIEQLEFSSKNMPLYTAFTLDQDKWLIAFANMGTRAFPFDIAAFNEAAEAFPEFDFLLLRDARLKAIRGPKSMERIEVLQQDISNGDFRYLERDERLKFEQLVTALVDYQNKELDVPMEALLNGLSQKLGEDWFLGFLLSRLR